jgi:hypothetical protein
MLTATAPNIREQDPFLDIFPHRYDFLWAPHPKPGERPAWQTESRYPLSDRLINQGTHLYGIRFGPTTRYALIDIDAGSAYHPRQDEFALDRLMTTLEPMGLVRTVICTSSSSGGLHLYLPFAEAIPSWKVAMATTSVLENAGFAVTPGQIEVFPNAKAFAESPTLFNGHRLPLQQGSYLLTRDLEPRFSDRQTFSNQWRQAATANLCTEAATDTVIRQAKRRQYRVSTKAQKFLNDLNAEIEAGWTGPGQTNHLLGRIAMRSYIFGHVLYAPEPLEGEALIADIIRIAQDLPGFRDWCSHKEELEKKAKEWTRSVENSHYYAYAYGGKALAGSTGTSTPIEIDTSWNQRQAQEARNRIRAAVADMLEEDVWPAQATARFRALKGYKIGSDTLYRHKDLWHPDHLRAHPNEPEPTPDCGESPSHGARDSDPPNLFDASGGNALQDKELPSPIEAVQALLGGNELQGPELIAAVLREIQERKRR